jgi:hypothetical protein
MKTFTCTNCDRALPTADAICTYCEEVFSLLPITGRYSCPNCTKRFEDPTEAYFPASAKWYHPRHIHPQCPHCLTFLRDKMRPSNSWIEILSFPALGIIQTIYRLPIKIYLLGVFILISITLIRWSRAKSSVRVEEERYAAK